MYRLKQSILAAVVIAVAACIPTRTLTVDENKPLSHPGSLPTYRINLNMISYEKYAEQYPNIHAAVNRAINEWEKRVPIDFSVIMEPKDPKFGVSGFYSFLSPIKIIATDVHDPAIGFESIPTMVGLWDAENGRLLLDDSLEEDPDVAYAVALHELGHLLGLPHIVSPDEFLTYNGQIVVEENAEDYVMFPRLVEDAPVELSELEIKMATEYVTHHLTSGSMRLSVDNCLHQR